MPRSSRHKSHKHSKHSSRDYSDSEEEVIKTEKRSKDENSSKVHRDSASGEKRKVSSQAREGKDRDLSGHGNGQASEEYVSSKRRKEKTDAIGRDRWCGGVDDRVDDDSDVGKEMHKGENSRGDRKLKEHNNKSEETESKSKRHEGGISCEKRDDSLVPMVVGKEEGKGRGESKRRSEREKDTSARKEARELKEKDYRLDKEKNGEWEGKGGGSESKSVDVEVGKKQEAHAGDSSKERQGKRSRDRTDQTLQDELRNPELEKEFEKKVRRKREDSSEKEKHHVDSKEGDERRLSSRGDRAKDVKYRDSKHKDTSYADKYQEDGCKDERRRDEKYRDEADKDNKYVDDKHREDGEKDVRRKSDRHRQDRERDNRRKDEKHREDRERDSIRKDDKYYEDGDRDNRHKDTRYADKDIKRGDESHLEDESTDDRHREITYKDDDNRNNRHKEEKHRKDIDREIRQKDSKQGDGHDKEKKPRDTKQRDEPTSRDRAGHRSDTKRSRDDDYTADNHSRKSSAYDDSPTRDDRAARYRDDQRRRKTDEKEDFGDIKSQSTKDRRFDTEKKSGGSERMDPAADRVRSSSRIADVEHTSSHSRRRSSPSSSAHASRDDYRPGKHDESKYRDYNYDERSRHNTSSRDYTGSVGGSDKIPSRPMEKHSKKDGHLQELSAERHQKSDVHASPLEHVDKSPASSADRRQLSRADVQRGADIEESTQRSGGSRDWKEYSVKEPAKGGRESAGDVIPGELQQPDADTLSVSSPYMRNSHFSSSSKQLLPPSIRAGMDIPSPLGSAEDEGRGKSNIRQRRIGDPSMGRIQGNSWRGTPSWPSSVANGFMPFPPPVGFHSVLHPFPAPPMYGVRPSMDLDNPSPYHIPDTDRFSGPGYPMGWRPQIDNSGRSLHPWDANNAAFGGGSSFYGRSDWDLSGNVPGSRGWEMNEDLLRGQNRTASMEMQYSSKENGSVQSGDEASGGQSLQLVQNEQVKADQPGDNTDLTHSANRFEKNEVEDPVVSLDEDSSDAAKMSRKDYMRLCRVYFSKLDISADLAEPELFNECRGFIDVDQSVVSDVDDLKILFVGEGETKMPSHKLLSCTMFASTDDSVFQKSMSLYQKQKVNFRVPDGDKLNSLNDFILNPDQEGQKVDVKTEKLCPEGEIQILEDIVSNTNFTVDSRNTLQKEDDTAAIATGAISASDLNIPNSTFNLEHEADEKLLCNAAAMDSVCKEEEMKLVVDTKYESILSSEAMMPESVMSGSVNLSRIHHSPENTH